MKTVSINQPCYLPWLGYFDRIAKSDIHVVLDTVQFEKNSFTNRNRIRQANGWNWLSVPLLTKGKFGDLCIADIKIAGERPWARKHLQSLRQSYAKTKWFAEHEQWFAQLYAREHVVLLPLLNEMTDYFMHALGISTPVVSARALHARGTKSDLVLNICRELEADIYLSGPFGRSYLALDDFAKHGIDVRFHDYRHPEYPQIHGEFEPNMAVVDALFNCGPGVRALIGEQGTVA